MIGLCSEGVSISGKVSGFSTAGVSISAGSDSPIGISEIILIN